MKVNHNLFKEGEEQSPDHIHHKETFTDECIKLFPPKKVLAYSDMIRPSWSLSSYVHRVCDKSVCCINTV